MFLIESSFCAGERLRKSHLLAKKYGKHEKNLRFYAGGRLRKAQLVAKNTETVKKSSLLCWGTPSESSIM